MDLPACGPWVANPTICQDRAAREVASPSPQGQGRRARRGPPTVTMPGHREPKNRHPHSDSGIEDVVYACRCCGMELICTARSEATTAVVREIPDIDTPVTMGTL